MSDVRQEDEGEEGHNIEEDVLLELEAENLRDEDEQKRERERIDEKKEEEYVPTFTDISRTGGLEGTRIGETGEQSLYSKKEKRHLEKDDPTTIINKLTQILTTRGGDDTIKNNNKIKEIFEEISRKDFSRSGYLNPLLMLLAHEVLSQIKSSTTKSERSKIILSTAKEGNVQPYNLLRYVKFFERE
jgi:hypothetical protein